MKKQQEAINLLQIPPKLITPLLEVVKLLEKEAGNKKAPIDHEILGFVKRELYRQKRQNKKKEDKI